MDQMHLGCPSKPSWQQDELLRCPHSPRDGKPDLPSGRADLGWQHDFRALGSCFIVTCVSHPSLTPRNFLSITVVFPASIGKWHLRPSHITCALSSMRDPRPPPAVYCKTRDVNCKETEHSSEAASGFNTKIDHKNSLRWGWKLWREAFNLLRTSYRSAPRSGK